MVASGDATGWVAQKGPAVSTFLLDERRPVQGQEPGGAGRRRRRRGDGRQLGRSGERLAGGRRLGRGIGARLRGSGHVDGPVGTELAGQLGRTGPSTSRSHPADDRAPDEADARRLPLPLRPSCARRTTAATSPGTARLMPTRWAAFVEDEGGTAGPVLGRARRSRRRWR